MAVKHDLREQVSTWMRNPDIRGVSGVVSLDLEVLAGRFTTSRHQMKAALDSLTAEEGSGVHKVSGHLWSYRHVEWEAHHPGGLTTRGTVPQQKPHDMNVRLRVYEYMMAQAPNTLHPVAAVAAATDALSQSASGALNWLSRRDFIPVERAYRGTYRRLPGTAPGMPDVTPGDTDPDVAELGEIRDEHEDAQRMHWVSSPAEDVLAQSLPAEARPLYSGKVDLPKPPGLTPPPDEEDDDRDWMPPAARHAGQRMVQVAEAPGWPAGDGWLRRLPPTRSGVLLAEDEKGEIYEVSPLTRRT